MSGDRDRMSIGEIEALMPCPQCRMDSMDYNIDCGGCRGRFRKDHNIGRFNGSKKLEYTFRSDTSILQVREGK